MTQKSDEKIAEELMNLDCLVDLDNKGAEVDLRDKEIAKILFRVLVVVSYLKN